jgi:hypothetical protein
MLRLLLAALALACPAAGARVWQPIIDYTISFPGDRADAAPMINSFENFTHFSSDFGWMGPGGGRIDAKGGIIRVKPAGSGPAHGTRWPGWPRRKTVSSILPTSSVSVVIPRRNAASARWP